jgi:hypothetical protein
MSIVQLRSTHSKLTLSRESIGEGNEVGKQGNDHFLSRQ